MEKTPTEIYNEIKREIIQISESYAKVKNIKAFNELPLERHCALLHERLKELITELKYLEDAGEIKISLVYKKMINKLVEDVYRSSNEGYKENVSMDIYFFTKEEKI